jgi:hypothetical protein
MKIKLNEKELAILLDYGRRANKSGGFQNLARTLYNRVDAITGELELDDVLLARIVRYSKNYRHGGFQDTFLRPVFRRTLNL